MDDSFACVVAPRGPRVPADRSASKDATIAAMRPFAIVFVLLLYPEISTAQALPRPLSIRELTATADTIAVGRVGAIESERTPGGLDLATRIRLDVEQVLKGAPAAALTIVQSGGEAGGVAGTVAGAPTFRSGEHVLVFLSRRPDGALRVAHLAQGKFTIETDAGTAPRAVRRAPDTASVIDALPLADALALVRSALAAPGEQQRRE